jgi:dGTPase
MDEEHFLGMRAAKRTNYDMIYKVDKVQRVLDVQVKPIMQKMYYKLLSDLKNGVKSSPIFKHHIDFIANHHYKAKKPYFESTEPNQIVVDYMASMTDDYCTELYHFLFPNDNVDFKYHGYFEDLYLR